MPIASNTVPKKALAEGLSNLSEKRKSDAGQCNWPQCWAAWPRAGQVQKQQKRLKTMLLQARCGYLNNENVDTPLCFSLTIDNCRIHLASLSFPQECRFRGAWDFWGTSRRIQRTKVFGKRRLVLLSIDLAHSLLSDIMCRYAWELLKLTWHTMWYSDHRDIVDQEMLKHQMCRWPKMVCSVPHRWGWRVATAQPGKIGHSNSGAKSV